MSMWEVVEKALTDAEQVDNAARFHANRMARLLVGGLEKKRVDPEYLAALKRELHRYNIHTGRWRK